MSDKPQTTRHRIVGVKNVAGGQMVFIDTPGIHKPMHRMNRRMVDVALDALKRSRRRRARGRRVSARCAAIGSCSTCSGRRGISAILALNKVDRVKKPSLLPLMQSYAKSGEFKAIVPVAAFYGEGLDGLEKEILEALPEGPALYPEDYLTDQTERTLTAELIREKVLIHTRDELPYTTAVVIDQYEEPTPEKKLTRIFASILVDQESQKPIVVGKGGEMIKRIGTEARIDLEKMLDCRVFLDLHVKVRQDWRDDERLLDELGLGSKGRH